MTDDGQRKTKDAPMTNTTDVVSAIRELTNTKQLERAELLDLLKDGLHAALLKRFEETPKGPRLILSRADPLFVKALFKLEVPEIQQGIVEIRATAREAGSRTKIAVSSRDDSIDPVGACVGMKGSRVQAVVNELNGERIDIVPGSPACSRTPTPRPSRRSWTRISSRSPSGATGRTSGSLRSSPAGRSTCTRAASGWSAAGKDRSSLRCPRRKTRP